MVHHSADQDVKNYHGQPSLLNITGKTKKILQAYFDGVFKKEHSDFEEDVEEDEENDEENDEVQRRPSDASKNKSQIEKKNPSKSEKVVDIEISALTQKLRTSSVTKGKTKANEEEQPVSARTNVKQSKSHLSQKKKTKNKTKKQQEKKVQQR